jgi:membrane associated rhomboid family serine protease
VFPLKDNIPTERTPIVTIALLVLNVVAYFFWQQGGLTLGDPSSPHYLNNLIDYAAIPYEITHPGAECDLRGETVTCGQSGEPQPATWITPFTSMFMHGGLLHLGGNMLFLWIFGNNVEDAMGHVRFIVFYLLSGLAAMALQVIIEPDAMVPTVGASGAVAGVLGGYLILFPRARVLTLIFIVFFFTFIELPALLILGFWFVTQLLFGFFNLAEPAGGGGVAYFAHIGGFVFGMLAIKLFSDGSKHRAQLQMAWQRR